MRVPSRYHAGARSSTELKVSWVRPVPSALMVKTSAVVGLRRSPLSGKRVNTIFVPSGAPAGIRIDETDAVGDVRRRHSGDEIAHAGHEDVTVDGWRTGQCTGQRPGTRCGAVECDARAVR